MTAADPDLARRAHAEILRLLDARGPDKTICPSDAARALAGDADFRPYMEPVRAAVARLAAAGRIEVTQKGEPVRIGEARGPIRLGLKQRPGRGRETGSGAGSNESG
jgi:hypothetical protein